MLPELHLTATSACRPFLKWAGGKTQLLTRLEDLFPKRVRRYFEPFLGSGAAFFGIGNKIGTEQPVLSDINEHLIVAFEAVRDDPEALIGRLSAHAQHHSRDYYYSVRAMGLDAGSKLERAARLIYLNRTCFNGLFRLNRKGGFNVPMGRYKNPRICDVTGIRLASAALKDARLGTYSFVVAVEGALPGDFVYFDPPYDPLSTTSSFTSYTSENFGRPEQEALARCITDLTDRGVLVAMSNSATPFIRQLYSSRFRIESVTASRRINSKALLRGPVEEVVVLNY